MVVRMDSKYFKELFPYEKSYLLENFNQQIFNELLTMGLLVKDNKKNNKFKFKYVGLIILDDIILNCYPKYISNEDTIEEDFKQIIKVIKKYFDEKNDDDLKEFSFGTNEFNIDSFNLLSVMLFFIEDYYENGIYTKYQNILETNGNHEIDWNRTVNENIALIVDNKPYYTELETKTKYNDLFNYIRLLHEYIITDCSKYLQKSGLLDIFGLTPIELSDNDLNNFGHENYILEKISKELKVEFNTRKIKLLCLMQSYIKHKLSFREDQSIEIFGTSYYHWIWEKMCKNIFKDKLDCRLSELYNIQFNSNVKLKSIIENPKWIIDENEFEADKTLIPDIITFYETYDDNYFLIFDAKYYNYNIKGNKISKQPGIESVTKQYMYQLAYTDFINNCGFNKVINAFLFPKHGGEVENKGIVKLNKLFSYLEDIQIIMLPANIVNELYLNNQTIPILIKEYDGKSFLFK